MKLVIIGGHLSPALAVIESLPQDTKILFVGRKHSLEGDKAVSLEYKTINSLGIQFSEIVSGRLQRKFTRHTINSLLKFPIGMIQSLFILLKFKPDVVLGFGGYLSLPVAIIAFLLRIPVVIHEQTLEAGFANKIISIFAKKICISWESSKKYFPRSKTVLTGNPIRQFKIQNSKFKIAELDSKLPTIYVTGGSSGSHFINTLIEGCLKDLLRKFNVIHQTGDAKLNDYERLKTVRSNLPFDISKRYTLEKFIEPSHVGYILKNCDLVISRAGINTIIELIYFERPGILIPLPFSQGQEQLKNAKFLESLGLGLVLQQKEIDPKRLYDKIVLMFANINKYRLNKAQLSTMQKDASQNIVRVVEYVYGEKKDS